MCFIYLFSVYKLYCFKSVKKGLQERLSSCKKQFKKKEKQPPQMQGREAEEKVEEGQGESHSEDPECVGFLLQTLEKCWDEQSEKIDRNFVA